jgi:uncharacterized protein (TIGR03437 family)
MRAVSWVTANCHRAANQVQAFVEGAGYQPVLYAGAVRGELPGLMQVNVRINSDLIYYGRLTLTIMTAAGRPPAFSGNNPDKE